MLVFEVNVRFIGRLDVTSQFLIECKITASHLYNFLSLLLFLLLRIIRTVLDLNVNIKHRLVCRFHSPKLGDSFFDYLFGIPMTLQKDLFLQRSDFKVSLVLSVEKQTYFTRLTIKTILFNLEESKIRK